MIQKHFLRLSYASRQHMLVAHLLTVDPHSIIDEDLGPYSRFHRFSTPPMYLSTLTNITLWESYQKRKAIDSPSACLGTILLNLDNYKNI